MNERLKQILADALADLSPEQRAEYERILAAAKADHGPHAMDSVAERNRAEAEGKKNVVDRVSELLADIESPEHALASIPGAEEVGVDDILNDPDTPEQVKEGIRLALASGAEVRVIRAPEDRKPVH